MCERNFREAEPCGARIAKKRGLQHEERVGRRNSVERRVECGDEKRVPERAAFARALFVALQPIFERFTRATQGDTRAPQDDTGNAELFAERKKRIGCKRFEQVVRRAKCAGAEATAAAVARENARVEPILEP